MQCRVIFLPDQVECSVPEGTLISDAARLFGVFVDSPCGGNGTCGKCGVLLTEAGVSKRVLACQTQLTQDCTVTLEEKRTLSTLREGEEREVPFAPLSTRVRVQNDCFAAFDLGTTSIVCYLLDGETGSTLASAGMQNPQSAYGADVIARANYVLSSETGDTLKLCAVEALNELLLRVTIAANRTPEQVTLVSIVGNTVMHHILLKYPLSQLVRAPYVPFAYGSQLFPARELGLSVHAGAMVMIPPVVGGFVGADTVACLSATAFEQIAKPTLLLDIGTNGELVCTDGKRRVCCSTAAGPAFEGANLSCGMRAEEGAIDHVWMEHGEFRFTTIASAPARGICGSGLIDLISVLLRQGVIDETGRFQEMPAFADRLILAEDGQVAFVLKDCEKPITLSQKDVRELQLGKAAIRAGIAVLLDALKLKEADIRRVLLAGAFGSHLSPDALCDIDLLPESFRGEIDSIGNAAGEGAKLYVKNISLFSESELIARESEYIELTLSQKFSDRFIEAISFPAEFGGSKS